nr:DDE-type integrase/transposase/recombinase [Hyphomonas beringensis]
MESFVTKTRDKASTLKFIRKAMKRYGIPHVVVTDRCPSYRAAMKVIGSERRQETGRHLKIAPKTHTCHSDEEDAPCPVSGEREVFRNSLRSIRLRKTETGSNSSDTTHLTTALKRRSHLYFRSRHV